MEKLIMQRMNCTEATAKAIASDLKKLNPQLRPMLEAWVNNKPLPGRNVKYHGYSLDDLTAQFGLKFTGAILTLDWLIRDPDAALKAIRYGIR